MHIGLDARTVFAPTRRGTGKNLIDLYSTLAQQRPGWTFTMFHQSDGRDDPFREFPNIQNQGIDIRGDRWNLWQDVRLPLAAQQAAVDVLHCPANTAPYWAWTPLVVTVHDLIPLETAPGAPATRQWKRRVARSARLARHVITPSSYSRAAITTQLGIPSEKMTVNYWAPDRRCRRVTDAGRLADVRQRYELPPETPYVLAFGGDDPRKNTDVILEAWSRLRSRAPIDARLLLIGFQPAALEHYRSVLQRSTSADGTCLLHGFAREEDIPALLSGAIALCYPSRSEGFGLPIVDAFTCGTPVITSTVTSLPEIAGDAALLVEPSDTDALAGALQDVLTSEPVRERLRQNGERRLGLFSWDRCAATVAGVFERVTQRKGANELGTAVA
jgi:glycosyltransferase involved in cell wall biosynthesis